MTGVSVAGVVRYETDYGILLMSVCQNPPQGGGCQKSQTFLSENRESASGLVWGIGVFRFPLIPDPSLGLGRDEPEMSVSSAPAGQSYKQKDLLNFSKSLNSYWVRESNPYCKIENLEY